jgi:hypothetical protein
MAKLIQTVVRTDFNITPVNTAYFVPKYPWGPFMKNFVQGWVASYNDGMGNLLGYVFTDSSAEADAYIASLGGSVKQMYYFLLNKPVVMGLINGYNGWAGQISGTDGTLLNQVIPFTQNRDEAESWGTTAPAWQLWTDQTDPAIAKATEVAAKIIANKPPKQDLGGGTNLITNFINLMNQLIATYKRKRDARMVGILQFMLLEFQSGKKSITQLLQELENLFIV